MSLVTVTVGAAALASGQPMAIAEMSPVVPAATAERALGLLSDRLSPAVVHIYLDAKPLVPDSRIEGAIHAAILQSFEHCYDL